MERKNRNSNIELLRIIAMFGIVSFHSLFHGGYKPDNYINSIYSQFMLIFGEVGVNIFILITGFFGVEWKINNLKRILKIWGVLFFYSVSIYLFSCSIGIEVLTIKGIIKSFFPILMSTWWFARTYIFLIISAPFINKLLEVAGKKRHAIILFILFMSICFIPTFTMNIDFVDNKVMKYIWFVFLYCLAGYIRLYMRFNKKQIIFIGIIGCVTILFCLLFSIVMNINNLDIPLFGVIVPYFYNMYYLPTLTIALSFFLFVKEIDIGSSKLINSISMVTFDVYLIHDHKIIRNLLWNETFNLDEEIMNIDFILLHLFTAIIVFVFCLIVGRIRVFFIDKLWGAKRFVI